MSKRLSITSRARPRGEKWSSCSVTEDSEAFIPNSWSAWDVSRAVGSESRLQPERRASARKRRVGTHNRRPKPRRLKAGLQTERVQSPGFSRSGERGSRSDELAHATAGECPAG